MRSLIGLTLVATLGSSAVACPPYVRECWASNQADRTLRLMREARCTDGCEGALLVNGREIYKVADKNTTTTVTSDRARELLVSKPAWLVYPGEDAWQRTAIDYLVSIQGKK